MFLCVSPMLHTYSNLLIMLDDNQISLTVTEDVDMDTTNATVSRPLLSCIKQSSSGYNSVISQSLGKSSTTEGMFLSVNW